MGSQGPHCTADIRAALPATTGGFPGFRGLTAQLSEPTLCLVHPRHWVVKSRAADQGQDCWALEAAFLILALQGILCPLGRTWTKSRHALTVIDRKHSLGVSDEEGFVLQKISVRDA